jgi:hypothetical protein
MDRDGGRAISDAFGGYIRWALFWLALGALFIGAGGGAVLSALVHNLFVTWEFWTAAVPGAVWAVFIALVALWASMYGQRRFLFFGPRRAPAGAAFG